jgi:hypothetical protein
VDCEKQESVLNVKAMRTFHPFHRAAFLDQNVLELACDNLKLQNVIETNKATPR